MLDGMKAAREALDEYYREDAPVMMLLDAAIVEAEGSERAYELLFKENAKLRSLVELIFASTLPYNDGEPTFSDKVTDAWKELTPNAEVRGASRLAGEASSREAATSTVVLGTELKGEQ